MYELTEQTRTRFLGRFFFPDNWAGFPCCVVLFGFLVGLAFFWLLVSQVRKSLPFGAEL